VSEKAPTAEAFDLAMKILNHRTTIGEAASIIDEKLSTLRAQLAEKEAELKALKYGTGTYCQFCGRSLINGGCEHSVADFQEACERDKRIAELEKEVERQKNLSDLWLEEYENKLRQRKAEFDCPNCKTCEEHLNAAWKQKTVRNPKPSTKSQ
jgi:hypothetical protein